MQPDRPSPLGARALPCLLQHEVAEAEPKKNPEWLLTCLRQQGRLPGMDTERHENCLPEWMARIIDDVAVVFWARVRKPEAGCWNWPSREGTIPGQYGSFSLHRFGVRRPISTHKLAWVLANRSWPQRYENVCHTCDNPRCVKPEHLFLGTHQDNALDAVEKGRMRSSCKRPGGVRSAHSEMLTLYRESLSIREIARRTGISRGSVRNFLLENGLSTARSRCIRYRRLALVPLKMAMGLPGGQESASSVDDGVAEGVMTSTARKLTHHNGHTQNDL